MIRQADIRIAPGLIDDLTEHRRRVARQLGLADEEIRHMRLVKRSIDARKGMPVYVLRYEVSLDEPFAPEPVLSERFRDVSAGKEVIIVGAGPAGYFAALEMLELGLKPVIFDRGKDVRARRRDLRAIQQFGVVNPHSNYCFGEGGAGTYSDGKLYTRSHKRGDVYKALKLLVAHGARADILIDAHPHIGSNKLPKVVANIRETILHHGGQIHFGHHVTDLIVREGRVRGVVVNDEREYPAEAVILATGHSARDVYYLLHRKGIRLEPKPFALGVRIEHPQALIDEIQYKHSPRHPNLPAASYKLVCQVDAKGVFSFCMCPGGLVVPAATAPGEIVVNGMSMSRRDSAWANSGTVTALDAQDWQAWAHEGVFAGLALQRTVEQACFQAGDGSQKAPAQRLTDFVAGRMSTTLPPASYIPGLFSAPVHELLPDFIYRRLQRAVRIFGKKMKGYFTAEANVIATESRTSAPVRIPRDPDTRMHPQVEGLFPAGEGAGYAGGIISAAMDGQNTAQAVARWLGVAVTERAN